jgi:hypothetical protein
MKLLMASAFIQTTTRLFSPKSRSIQRIGLSELEEAMPDVPVPVPGIPAVDSIQDTVSQISQTAVLDADTITKIAESKDAVPDLDTIALVVGQENYGLAVVLLGEAIWSLSKAPSLDHALKTLVPAGIAAAVLIGVSGPQVTSG